MVPSRTCSPPRQKLHNSWPEHHFWPSLTALGTHQTAVPGGSGLGTTARPCHIICYKGLRRRGSDLRQTRIADSRTAAAVRNRTEPPVHITRREFAIGTGAIALVGVGAAVGFSVADSNHPVLAQSAMQAELMKPGPLGDMSLGDEKAPVTIIEYASMTCPHCANFHETTYPELKKKYIDTGKWRFIFREFPLDQLAAAAFMLARCGGKERYFPMVETLFQQQRTWAVSRPLQPLMAIDKQ